MTAAAYNPVGELSSVTAANGTISTVGWASDPDDPAAALAVHVYLDGVGKDVVVANPAAGGVAGSHGFRAQFSAGYGRHTVCAYAINIGQGTTNVLLGCRGVQV